MAIVILSGGWGIRPLWSRTFGGTDLANERGGGCFSSSPMSCPLISHTRQSTSAPGAEKTAVVSFTRTSGTRSSTSLVPQRAWPQRRPGQRAGLLATLARAGGPHASHGRAWSLSPGCSANDADASMSSVMSGSGGTGMSVLSAWLAKRVGDWQALHP